MVVSRNRWKADESRKGSFSSRKTAI